MRQDIHPEYKATKVTCGCGNSFETRSTKDVIRVEICSNCHPFYTGKQKFVDTAGMVEKFKRKWGTLEDRRKAKEEEEKKAAARKQQRRMRQAVIPATLKSLPEQKKPEEAPAQPEAAPPAPAPQPAPEPAPPAPAPEAPPSSANS